MKKMSSLLALSMSACIAVFLITTDAKAQKTQDRMPAPPGGRGGLPAGVTSRAPREGEVFNDRPGSAESRKTDRWGRDNDSNSGSSAASRKQDRLPTNPNAANNRGNVTKFVWGYGYGRSTTPKIQDRLRPSPDVRGSVVVQQAPPNLNYNSRAYGIPRGTKLNAAEMVLYSNYPDLIGPVSYARAQAYNETQRRFGKNSEDDASDAFRHAYAAALLTRYVGPQFATMVTDAHERTIVDRSRLRGRAMDYYNNRVGIDIGYRYGRLSEEQLANITMDALRRGYLMVLR